MIHFFECCHLCNIGVPFSSSSFSVRTVFITVFFKFLLHSCLQILLCLKQAPFRKIISPKLSKPNLLLCKLEILIKYVERAYTMGTTEKKINSTIASYANEVKSIITYFNRYIRSFQRNKIENPVITLQSLKETVQIVKDGV